MLLLRKSDCRDFCSKFSLSQFFHSIFILSISNSINHYFQFNFVNLWANQNEKFVLFPILFFHFVFDFALIFCDFWLKFSTIYTNHFDFDSRFDFIAHFWGFFLFPFQISFIYLFFLFVSVFSKKFDKKSTILTNICCHWLPFCRGILPLTLFSLSLHLNHSIKRLRAL